MPPIVNEQTILESLRRIPEDRWGEVLHYLDALSHAGPMIQTGEDLLRSGLVGLWDDRDDLGDHQEFARQMRRQAETRRGVADAAGH